MYQDILNSTAHRDCPLPQDPWIMMQQWDHLLFIHRPIQPHVLEEYLPQGLVLDTFNSKAWISIIPFKVSKIRLRKMPLFPFIGSFLQINVRTYVKRNGIKGVYFFSVDENQLLMILGSKVATLPSYYADMSMKRRNGYICVDSERRGKTAGILRARYEPTGEFFHPEKGSLEYWLIERYFLWTYRNGSLYRGVIHHKQWTVKKAAVNMEQSLTTLWPNNFLNSGFLAHYALSQIALIWLIRREMI
ncbi:hypothetical protein SAMN04488072_102246 [Lentibacillus halodurans]|uniref:DUF2071 domain-containing protein n=1 Tax=Lentibacillus halodurans TaxID=237679 RepID=A0A1I0W6B4_9BACI|nr:DUF2071 domain-containing protein [Lentibacillus halodurans]SFA84074.1 hypothetical protein SAMN04488072_102246 [Lentibacillus halodurans]